MDDKKTEDNKNAPATEESEESRNEAVETTEAEEAPRYMVACEGCGKEHYEDELNDNGLELLCDDCE